MSVTAVMDAYQSAHFPVQTAREDSIGARDSNSRAGVEGDAGMVQAALNRLLDAHPFATFSADERFDDSEAQKGIQRSAVRAASATDHLRTREFHQP